MKQVMETPIRSRDFWVKVVEMLQQNWALIDETEGGGARIYFVDDGSDVFDRMSFPTLREGEEALRRNGFKPFASDPRLQGFLSPPVAPFHESQHPNGPIYSSGRFWLGPTGRALSPDSSGSGEGEDVSSLAFSGRLRVATDPGRIGALGRGKPSWDRVSGMLLGLAIGDALGITSESQMPSDRRARHGEIRDYLPNRYAEGRRVGLPSDDTQLAFWTLEHLLEVGCIDPSAPRRCNRVPSDLRHGVRRSSVSIGPAKRTTLARGGAGLGRQWRPHANRARASASPRLAGTGLWRDAVVAGAVTHNDFASNASCGAFVGVLLDALNAIPPVRRGLLVRRFVEVGPSPGRGRAALHSPRAGVMPTDWCPCPDSPMRS